MSEYRDWYAGNHHLITEAAHNDVVRLEAQVTELTAENERIDKENNHLRDCAVSWQAQVAELKASIECLGEGALRSYHLVEGLRAQVAELREAAKDEWHNGFEEGRWVRQEEEALLDKGEV